MLHIRFCRDSEGMEAGKVPLMIFPVDDEVITVRSLIGKVVSCLASRLGQCHNTMDIVRSQWFLSVTSQSYDELLGLLLFGGEGGSFDGETFDAFLNDINTLTKRAVNAFSCGLFMVYVDGVRFYEIDKAVDIVINRDVLFLRSSRYSGG